MNLELWWIGKTAFPYLESGISDYASRLKHYARFGIKEFPDDRSGTKNPASLVKEKEGNTVLSKLDQRHVLILLDESGKGFNSVAFASFLQDRMNYSPGKTLVFLIGGAFGFSKAVYDRADYVISLSSLTFSHQMVRLIFLEQLYRAFTILKGEKYHNP